MNTLVICSKCESLNRVALERADQAKPVCGKCKSELSILHGVQELTAQSLKSLIQKSPLPVVVDFWAPWCGPCIGFAPTFQKAAQELADKMVLAKLNTEEHPHASDSFQIRGIPTLIVFKDGKEVARQSGAMPFSTLMGYLNQFKK